MRGTSRRAFFRACAGAAGAMAIGRAGPQAQPQVAGKAKARVVVAQDPGAAGADLSVRAGALRPLLEATLRKLTGAADLPSALARLFKPEDRIGIKVNCLAGRGLSSHPELVLLLCEALQAAGIPGRQIVIWDRTDVDLKKAGFALNRGGSSPYCYGTNADYEPEPTDVGSVGSCFSRILTEQVTALISVPVLKDHDLAGVSGSLKNFYGAIHNPNKYHDDNCHPFVADVNAHPAIKGKLRLVLCDALVAQCHGGPSFKPEHAWPFGGLIASTDPVAADRVAFRLIEERRRQRGLPTLAESKREPRYIAAAGDLGLGTADPSRIDEVTA